MTAAVAGAVTAMVTLGGGGCSWPADELPRPGTCNPFTIEAIEPAPGARGVPVDVVPTVTFSDFPDPDTVGLSSLTVTLNGSRYTGTYRVDLVDRRVSIQPSGNLQSGISLTLTLTPRVRSLRRCLLEAPPPFPDGTPASAYYVHFETAEPGTPLPPREPPPPAPAFAEIAGLFAGRCAAGCHAGDAATGTGGSLPGDEASCLDAPAGGLSLCARDARAHLVGIASREVARLVRVAPRDSSRSYLLRKLLGAPPLAGHLDPPGQEPLTPEQQRAIARWIDAGAPP